MSFRPGVRGFEMQGLYFRADLYEKVGDTLPRHAHPDFEHGVFVTRGRVRVTVYRPVEEGGDHVSSLTPQDGAILFKAGREHTIEAEEDDTETISTMPSSRAP